MHQYHNLINDILTRGVDVFNSRTGAVCKTLVGCQLSFPATGRDFPALTTRKLPFKSIVGELLGFFRGYTSAEDFRALGCKFWDANANETKAWLSNPYRRGTDDLGRIYGAQWTGWSDKRVVFDSLVEEYLQQGYLYRGHIEYEHAPNRYDPTGATYDGLVLMERYINQLENAVRAILTNPSDRRIIVSGWNVAEFDRMALPPCFDKSAIVTMKNGYRYINKISVGDEVISGNGVIRKVTAVFETPYTGTMYEIKIKYIPQSLKCTPNHPFLVKDKGWIEAQHLKEGDMVCIKKSECKENHTFSYILNNPYNQETIKEHTLTIDDYFTLGYYVGNGWINLLKDSITFSIPNKKADYLLDKLRKTIKVSKIKNSGINCSKYETRSKKWINLFSEFGFGAENKYIPEWVFHSTIESKKAFIDGYLEADGYTGNHGRKFITTTSIMLAYGIQRLQSDIGLMAGLVFQERPLTTVIEGRKVNQKPTYNITIPSKRNNFSSFDDDFTYVPIDKITTYQDSTLVYNLSVEEDHTYNVNNIVNHNCHIQYNFIPMQETEEMSVVMTIRSMDVFLGTPANIASTAVFLAVMCRLTGYTPGEVIIQGANAHLYENSFDVARELLTREHFPAPRLVLSEAIREIKDLKDITGCFARIQPEDIYLEDYQSHGVLTVPMVA